MDRRELFLAVNPVFATAKGCLGLLQNTGIKEAAALGNVIDTTVKGALQTPPEILKAYMVSNEARYHIGNIMAEQSGCDVIVDLPCGYVPRGLVVSDTGKQFYGLDLPAVIEEVEPAIRKIASKGQNKRMHFQAVDATNLNSLKDALHGVQGKLCILTDGLLGYFNGPELNSVCDNIKELLSEHGGMWITADKYARELGAETFTALTDSNGEIVKQMMSKGGTQVADIPVNHTVIQGTVPEAKQYFLNRGFVIRETSYADIVPDLLSVQKGPEIMKKLRQAYQNIMVWTMTVRPATAKQDVAGKIFAVQFDITDDTLYCNLSGRLDTMTAPELYSKFQAQQTNQYSGIIIDLANTEYISSAGLRVFLAMFKSLPKASGFLLRNPSEEVFNILDITGFTDIFKIEKH